MNCPRCAVELPAELAAKAEIFNEMFGEDIGWLCDTCYDRFIPRVKRLWHRLTCDICWEYHNWWDFKQWVKSWLSYLHFFLL